VSKMYIDIGGTKLRCELLLNDIILKEEVLSIEVDLIEYIEKKISKYNDINFIGISFAGQVDDGVILSSPNIKIKEKDIKSYIFEKYKIALKIENDLKCALIAERNHTDESNIAMLFTGTGLGSAVLDNGRIVRGEKNIACEIGHIPFKKAPFLCGCGKNNCVELFASGSGLEKWENYYDLPKFDLEELSVSKDKNAKKIYKNFIEALLVAAGNIITLFNPKVLILGGGVIRANPYLLDVIRENIKNYAFLQSCEDLNIIISKLKNSSLEGAKLL